MLVEKGARTKETNWREAEIKSWLTLNACPGMQTLLHFRWVGPMLFQDPSKREAGGSHSEKLI